MRLATWNVNGIRSLKKPLSQIFRELDADIICFQETKITRDQLDEAHAFVDGYSSYFSFSTVKSGYSGVATFCRDAVRPVRAQEGLTGLLSDADACCNGIRVATPTASIWRCTEADVGMWAWQSAADELAEATTATRVSDPVALLRQLDAEGRAVITQHVIRSTTAGQADGAATVENGDNKLLTVINVYCPCVNPEQKDDRESFRLHFLGLLGTVVRGLVASGSAVIVAGDLNVAHKPIDHCDPGDVKEFENRPARRWASALLLQPSATTVCCDGAHRSPSRSAAASTTAAAATPHTAAADDRNATSSTAVLVDAFRHLHPTVGERGYTCWSSATGARLTNYGTRIDYVLVSSDVTHSLVGCDALQDYDGSDHCPVVADCGGGGSLQLLPASELPPACAAFLTKFKAKQSKLSSFVLRGAAAVAAAIAAPIGTAGGHRARSPGRLGLSQPQARERGKQQGQQPALRAAAGKAEPRKRCLPGPADRDFSQSTVPAWFSKKVSRNSSSAPAGDRNFGTPLPIERAVGKRPMLQPAATKAMPTSVHAKLARAPETGLSERPTHDRADGCGAIAATETTGGRCAVAVPAEADDAAASTGSGRGLVPAWRLLFEPRAAPVCKGHSEPCTMHTVKKEGPNRGRQFYACARPVGRTDNPLSRCSHFEWARGPKQ